jgi:hypothetical protein
MLLSISYYKLACHYFPIFVEYFMYSHLPYFLYIAAQKMKNSLMKASSMHAGSRSSAYGVVLVFTA